MRKITLLTVISLLFLTSAIKSADKISGYNQNPVFKPSQGQTALNPCVIYDQAGFESKNLTTIYKMWFATENGVALAYSNDGLVWTEYNNSLSLPGLQPSANLPYVIYDKDGFGGTNYYYKIWYWNGVSDSIESIRTAESIDGIIWENDKPVQQHLNDASLQLVTDGAVFDGYFSYCYGPASIFYNPKGTDIGSTTPADKTDDQPMTYHYIMYYNSSNENLSPETNAVQTSLAYSNDGIYWTRSGDKPVIAVSGKKNNQDSQSNRFVRIIQSNGKYSMWYFDSASESQINPSSIEMADSVDGLNWSIQSSAAPKLEKIKSQNINQISGYSINQIEKDGIDKLSIWASVADNNGINSINYYEKKINELPGGEYKGINIDQSSGYTPFTFTVWIDKQDWSHEMTCYVDEMYWKWDFGDGTNRAGYDKWKLQHTYDKGGTYTISATNLCKGKYFLHSDTQIVEVEEGPFPCFSVRIDTAFAHLLVYFNNDCMHMPSGVTIVTYAWDFGDGQQTIYTYPYVSHRFSSPGYYTVTLVVTDSQGITYSFSQTITIKGLYSPSNITLEKQINRSLFAGKARNVLNWTQNSQIFECTITNYNIYRKINWQFDTAYQLIASVNGDQLTYTDDSIELDTKYTYVITAVESGGHESEYSTPVSNQ